MLHPARLPRNERAAEATQRRPGSDSTRATSFAPSSAQESLSSAHHRWKDPDPPLFCQHDLCENRAVGYIGYVGIFFVGCWIRCIHPRDTCTLAGFNGFLLRPSAPRQGSRTSSSSSHSMFCLALQLYTLNRKQQTPTVAHSELIALAPI
jgi:hypothetical protein